MKRIATVILLTLLAAGLALAQESQPATKAKEKEAGKATASAAAPSIDQILDKFVQAIGGKAAHEKLTSSASKGSFEIPAMGATGTVEAYAKAPNKTVTIVTIAGFGEVREGYNGTTAWAQDPMNGLREKSGVELARTKLDADFYRFTRLKQLFPKMELKGKEKVEDHETYVILATPAEGNPEKMYFDTQSGLLVRLDREVEGPQGKLPVEVYLDDYREVSGIKMPFTVRQSTPAFSAVLKFEEVKFNVPVEDAKFNKPAQ